MLLTLKEGNESQERLFIFVVQCITTIRQCFMRCNIKVGIGDGCVGKNFNSVLKVKWHAELA